MIFTRTARRALLGVATAASLIPTMALACGPEPMPIGQFVLYEEPLFCVAEPCGTQLAAYDVGGGGPIYVDRIDLGGLALSELDLQRTQKDVMHGRLIVTGDFIAATDGMVLQVTALLGPAYG